MYWILYQIFKIAVQTTFLTARKGHFGRLSSFLAVMLAMVVILYAQWTGKVLSTDNSCGKTHFSPWLWTFRARYNYRIACSVYQLRLSLVKKSAVGPKPYSVTIMTAACGDRSVRTWQNFDIFCPLLDQLSHKVWTRFNPL